MKLKLKNLLLTEVQLPKYDRKLQNNKKCQGHLPHELAAPLKCFTSTKTK